LLNHTSDTEGGIKIFARRDEVDEVNRTNIRNLPSKPHSYTSLDTFIWQNEHRDDQTLEKNTRRTDTGSLNVLVRLSSNYRDAFLISHHRRTIDTKQ
jgi:hypothetical protein